MVGPVSVPVERAIVLLMFPEGGERLAFGGVLRLGDRPASWLNSRAEPYPMRLVLGMLTKT